MKTTNHDHTHGRACARCGASLEGKRSDAVYCSYNCRKAVAQRRRYHADPEKARAKRRARYGRLMAKRDAYAKAAALVADCQEALATIAALLHRTATK